MTDVKITHIEEEPSAIDPLQISITPGNDPQIGQRVLGFKDSAGDARKCLNKSAHAPVKSLNVSDFTAAGILRTDSSGNIYGDVNSLGDLNTALGGTTIDESTDPRDPNAHTIGGAAHSASTLAELNTKVSDATLDDSGDPRTPTQHAIGSATLHSSSTLAELNALVSDATLDTSSASRPPTAHAGSHESGGSDQLEHNKFYDLNTGDYRHIDPSPAAGGTGWEVTDADFTGLGDSVSAKSIGAKTINASVPIAGDSTLDVGSFIGGNYKYFYIADGSNNLKRLDTKTLEVYESVVSDNRALVAIGDYVYVFDNGLTIRYNADDLSISTSFATTGPVSIISALWSPVHGWFYAVDEGKSLYKIEIGPSVYTATLIDTLSEISSAARSICLTPDGAYIYVADFTYSGSVGTVKKFAIDGTHQYTSPVIATTLGRTASIYCSSDSLKVVHGSLVEFLSDTGSSLTLDVTLSSDQTFAKSFVLDGLIFGATYNSTSYNAVIANIPSLTLKSSGHLDLTSVKSSAYNNGSGIYSLDDFCRATEHAKDAESHLLPFDTFADLSGTSGSDGQIAELLGYYATGDGGGGTFIFDSSLGPGDVNGVTIVSGGAGGCWVRQCPAGVVYSAWGGAKGDGVTDDTSALQACLDTLDGEGDFLLNPGTYYITSALTIPNSVLNGMTIRGIGSVRWQNTGTPTTVLITDQAINMIEIGTSGSHSLSGPIIKNLAFTDTSGVGAVTRGVYCISSSYVRLEDLSFGGITGGTCIDIDGSSATTINCEIRGCYGRSVLNGIKLTNANSTKIFGGYFSGGSLGGKGLEVTGGGDSVMVSQFSVDSFAEGVHCNSSTGAVMLANCRFEVNDYSIRVSSGGTHMILCPFIRNGAGQTGIRVEATAGTTTILSPGFLDDVGTRISNSGQYTTYYGGNRTPDKKVITTLENTATPSVESSNIYKTGSSRTVSPITNFTSGQEGQIITLFCDAPVTIQNNANVFLFGGQDQVLAVNDTIALLKVGTTWKQIGGSDNNALIDETKLDASVNASLDLADSAVQPGDLATVATTGSSADLSDAVRTITASDAIVVADRNGVIFSEPASADVYITLDAAVQAIPGFQFTIAVSESASYDTYVDAGGSSQNYLCGVSTGLLRGMFIFRVDKSGEAMPVQVPTITPPA